MRLLFTYSVYVLHASNMHLLTVPCSVVQCGCWNQSCLFKKLKIRTAPRELEDLHKAKGAAPGQKLHVVLNDKREEDYKEPPKPSYVAFSGAGQSLGGDSLGSGSAVSSSLGAGSVPVVDPSKPVTTIQLRLINGKRSKAQLNTTHTVQDLCNFVAHESPSDAFVLIGGYPPVPLADMR
jgi:UBX domain-containing protein 1